MHSETYRFFKTYRDVIWITNEVMNNHIYFKVLKYLKVYPFKPRNHDLLLFVAVHLN